MVSCFRIYDGFELPKQTVSAMKTELQFCCGQYNSIHDNEEQSPLESRLLKERNKRENCDRQSRKENSGKNVRSRKMGTVYSA